MLKSKAPDASSQKLPPDFKKRLKEHLLSKPFQSAFERMVKKSMRNGTETNFDVNCSLSRGCHFGSSRVGGGKHPNRVCDPGDFDEAEDRNCIDFVNKFDFTVISLHTHPYDAFDYDLGVLLPSPSDCAWISEYNTIGLIVPLDFRNRVIELVAFQNTRVLSHCAYENLLFEMRDKSLEEIEHEIARLSILRLIRFPKRDVANIKSEEIDMILDVMELRFNHTSMLVKSLPGKKRSPIK